MLGAAQDIDFGFGYDAKQKDEPPDRIHRTAKISPLAHVHEDCWIGAHTVIWQFASVIRRSQIGTGTKVASCAIVDGSRIGHDCIISHGAFIDPGIHIGDDVFVGPFVALCNDFWPRVDKSTWHDIDDLINGSVVVTRIGDGASIGAGAVIMPGITIGVGAMVAAHSCVTEDVPECHLWRRNGQVIPIDRVPDRKRVVAC